MSVTLKTLESPKKVQFESPEKLNNDPLAHVYLLMGDHNNSNIESRIFLEFITDMGERLENQPFCSSFDYSYDGQEIIYNTGILYLQSLRNSCIAAKQDVAKGTFPQYHLDRQIAFYRQGEIIKNWLDNKAEKRHLLLLSLCPTPSELTSIEAKKQSFKPDRQMASIQLHSKNSDGTATTTAFSLDGLTPQRLQGLFDTLGINATATASTLDQLTLPVFIDGTYNAAEAVKKIICCYDDNLFEQTGKMHKQGIDIERNVVESNSFVRSHPEAYFLYRSIIGEVASALVAGRVGIGLQTILNKDLIAPYKQRSLSIPHAINLRVGDVINVSRASGLLEYLRRKAIPEYLTQKLTTKSVSNDSNYGNTDGGDASIGSAGADAEVSGRDYDGDCPTSGQAQQSQNSSEQAAQMGLFNKKAIVKYKYVLGNCVVPYCPSSEGEDEVLVGPCSVCKNCQENLYDKGIDAVKYYKPSFFKMLGLFVREIIEEIFESNKADEEPEKTKKPVKNIKTKLPDVKHSDNDDEIVAE